jgi:hypothetical protein
VDKAKAVEAAVGRCPFSTDKGNSISRHMNLVLMIKRSTAMYPCTGHLLIPSQDDNEAVHIFHPRFLGHLNVSNAQSR